MSNYLIFFQENKRQMLITSVWISQVSLWTHASVIDINSGVAHSSLSPFPFCLHGLNSGVILAPLINVFVYNMRVYDNSQARTEKNILLAKTMSIRAVPNGTMFSTKNAS